MYRKAVHIFRRDLRLQDNTALLRALQESERVIPAFIFDVRQCDPQRNKRFSERGFAFLLQSLEELDVALQRRGSRLYTFHGLSEEVVDDLIRHDGVDAVFINKDYSPLATHRDKRIARVCGQRSVPFVSELDSTLSPIHEIVTSQGNPYTVFSPFRNKARSFKVAKPKKNTFSTYFTGRLSTKTVNMRMFAARGTPAPHIKGGRPAGRYMLRKMSFLIDYDQMRNYPALAGTSMLSAHHKFGTISIRETYRAAMRQGGHGMEKFIVELYWRDFFYHVARNYPDVYKQPLASWGDNVQWRVDASDLRAWQQGMTGIPLVDAGMRELNETGWMHNRARMIVASFLTKNLLIDWRKGEQYFARRLVDYDPAVNACSWQWCAQVGTDPRPLRIFNPYTQTTKYDPDAEYIKRYVPELRDVDSSLLADGKERDYHSLVHQYPEPLVSTSFSFHRARSVFAKAKQEKR